MSDKHFLEELRTLTGPVHKQIEHTFLSKQIISPDLGRGEYITYLNTVLSLHRDVERTVFPLLKDHFNDLAEREKTPKILQDLEQLQATPDAGMPGLIDQHFVPALSFCMGIFYVTEGSTLGGLYIARNVAAVMGEEAAQCSRFLTAYGPFTGSRWKSFLGILESYAAAAGPRERQEVIAGALYAFKRTFDLFNRSIEVA